MSVLRNQSPGPLDDERFSAWVTDLVQKALERVHESMHSVNMQLFDGHEPVTFANLPAVPLTFEVRGCTDCRKDGEGAAAGTGTLVYYDGAGWFRVADDTAAAI